MAANLVFKLLTDNSNLKRGIGNAKKELSGLDKATKQISSSMTKALGAVGLGLGLGQLVSGLKDAAKAAVEDSKAQAVLAASMVNTIGANEEQIKSTEAFIKSLELKTSILDDKLRPSYALLLRSTQDLAQSERLLTLATDVSAGSGKDLASVSSAIAKAYNGQFTSLNKLIPGITAAADPIAELERRFSGLAETAANNDPFARMQVIFENIQEELGTYLLPYLEQFANYLASPEGTKQLEEIVKFLGEMIVGFGQVVDWIQKNVDKIFLLIQGLGALRLAWGLIQIAVVTYTAGTMTAVAATHALKAALISTGIGAIVVGLGSLASMFVSTTAETQEATIAMDEYKDAVTGVVEKLKDLPTSNTNDSLTKPLNPRPGETYTWFNYSDRENPEIATWWTQTWTGKEWTKAKPMTYSSNAKVGGKTPAATGETAAERIAKMTDKVKAAGAKFRDALNLSSNLNETGDVFNVESALAKVRKVVDAAKKLPALLQRLRAKGASPAMLTDIFDLGPVGGVATASALLQGNNLTEFISAEKTLTESGMKAGAIAGANTANNNTYAININKANMTAEEIIAAIQKYERKTGKKVVFGG